MMELNLATLFMASISLLVGYYGGRAEVLAAWRKNEASRPMPQDGWQDECEFWRTEAFPLIRTLAKKNNDIKE